MLSWLRRLFAPPVDTQSERIARLERSLAEWEVTMTGLCDKMSTQLKRQAARHGGNREPSSEEERREALNRAIRLRRAGISPNGDA
jgi:hypothetical protein